MTLERREFSARPGKDKEKDKDRDKAWRTTPAKRI